ncbi:GH39 family glycosyl hydrolase [Chryseobacterium sp. GP-SGM7]|uniref:GH39 family glycosyl hydrolase n=1 Tax=Chryseobacterium sp. GP-SGM7 TaxID=3411323 RepID=UPI003B9299D0
MSKKFLFFIIIINSFINAKSQNLSNKIDELTVDLSLKSQKKESVAGFLHFNDLEPLEKNIIELKPKYWRFGAKLKDNPIKRKEQVNILLKYNIVPIIVLSDIYDEEHWYKEKGGWIRPSDDPRKFTTMIKSLYQDLGSKVVFDVWNEPNVKDVWGGTREEYFKTFKVAHDALRSSINGSNAMITGPSISEFNIEYITAFLDYCSKNNIKLDILNWHDLGNQKSALKLQDNIKAARELIKKYPNLGVRSIYIPEIVGLDEQFNPLTLFTYLYSLEKGNAQGGCKACWDNPDMKGENSCWNNSMDGILSQDGKYRASWWVYKYYAESLAKRITSESYNKEILSIASYDKNNNLSLLLGNTSDKNKENYTVNLKNIKDKKSFQNKIFKIYEIPNNGSLTVNEPNLIALKQIVIRNNNISITVKNLKAKSLYYLVVSKK